MVKVLELIDGGFLGGGQTHILSIAGNIDKKKYDLTIAASPEGEFRNVAEEKGFGFEGIKLPKIYRTKYLKQLAELVWENNYDIIHSHGGVAGMYARFLKKKYPNFKIIHTIHGIHYINSGNFLRNFLTKTIEQYLVPFTDKFICVSDHDFKTAWKLKIIDGSRTVIIKNGISLDRFGRKAKDKALIKKLGIGEGDLIIGNISRFDYQKNQRQIIRISRSILENNKNVKFLLIGNGKYLEKCKEMVSGFFPGSKDKFIFTGEVQNVEDYYPLIDIFVFPSLWEGFSITLLEALASSRCIAAGDIEPNKEIIKNGINGILFNTNDDGSFLNAVQNLVDDPQKRAVLAANAFNSSKKFSDTIMIRKIEQLYDELSSK
jgi:glycosyltransferase involved in cell wall biosynthesis